MSLRKGLQRLEGVAQAKLILKPPHMEVQMKPGYWPDLVRMQQTIKDAGYTPVPEQTELIVIGKVVKEEGKLGVALDKMRLPVTLRLVAAKDAPDTAARLERYAGQSVELGGYWQPASAGQSGPGALAVTALHRVEDKKP